MVRRRHSAHGAIWGLHGTCILSTLRPPRRPLLWGAVPTGECCPGSLGLTALAVFGVGRLQTKPERSRE